MSQAAEAILAGSQHFTEIGVPALAIFTSPHHVMTGDFKTSHHAGEGEMRALY
jgi:hypothetical protein